MSTSTHYVYFIECKDFVKIGHARDVKYRQGELQGGNPFELKLLGVKPCNCRENETSAGRHCTSETAEHIRFKDFRYKNEWFHKTPGLISYINALAPSPVVP